MKTSALNSSGEGLVYRGSFVLRRSSNGARTPESDGVVEKREKCFSMASSRQWENTYSVFAWDCRV